MPKSRLDKKITDFDVYIQKRVKDKRFKENYEFYGKQLEIAYQVLQLRKKENMSQADLAKKLGTSQSNVARLEAGEQNFTAQTLQKIAVVFNRDLKVEFV
ncbi:MAG: helix-turn-helix transcriptional regulator [Patescibacteria group bacterium]